MKVRELNILLQRFWASTYFLEYVKSTALFRQTKKWPTNYTNLMGVYSIVPIPH